MSNRRPRWPVAVAAATAQATAAAGSPTNPGASGGNVKACSLLTEQELTPLLGSDPGPGADNSDSTTTACAYTGAGVVTIVVDHIALAKTAASRI